MKRILLYGCISALLFAQKPVRIDEILTKTHHIKLDTTLAYSNIHTSDGVTQVQTIQTQNGDFVTLPLYLGTLKGKREYLNTEMTVRYGASKDLELYLSANGHFSTFRYEGVDAQQQKSDRAFDSIGIGATYQLKPEDATPSLLVGVGTKLFEKTKVDTKRYTHSFKNFRVFASSYYSVDPVVFFLSTSYSLNRSKKVGDHTQRDADIFTLSPQVYFAVNPYTSINWGIKYTHVGKMRVDGKAVADTDAFLSFVTGLSYEFNAKTFISVSAEFANRSASVQNSLSVTLSYTF